MRYELTGEGIAGVRADLAIGFMAEASDAQSPTVQRWSELTNGLAAQLVKREEFRGRQLSHALIHGPTGLAADRLMLVGVGKPEQQSYARIRDAVGAAWRKVRTTGVRSLVAEIPEGFDIDRGVRALVEGVTLADYEPDLHKSRNRKRSSLQALTVVAKGASQSALDRAAATAEAMNRARELANEPGNLLPPVVLAERAAELASGAGLECEVLGEQQLESLNMGALLGVARGSSQPPAMIVVRYRPEDAGETETHLGLVGKAVTFDTGGISLKPAADMHLMKHDMAGGAAMLGAMLAIAAVRPKIPVTAVIPSVENMPGADAQRPGDIVKTRSGTTVEVLNTDAEGRLILADALTYAKELGCTHLVDAATLTGAIVVALGSHYTGLFGNDEAWTKLVVQASKDAGERMWHMPLGQEYTEMLDSTVADLANIGPRWGGAVTAAAFLEHFADKTPWVHLDIAGTAWYEKPAPHAPVGASGAGVATLVELALGLG